MLDYLQDNPTHTKISHIQIDVDIIYTYLETLAMHTVSPLLFPFLTFREILENVKRNMAEHSYLAMPNDPSQDIWSYCEVL